ncbi:MAG: prolipoprotein diacylglyceryl transferase [Planctomycetia bacterium]|nr:prolipoprotein diacylglyceryl transferase [Planctomycetia bacterium]
MRQTLFLIPREIAGIDVFGFGWLLTLWAVGSVVLLTWSLWRHGGKETLGYLPVLAVFGLVIAFVAPVLLEPEGLPIRSYGVMFLAAFVSSVVLAAYRARQVGLDPEIILSLGLWFLVSGIFGARLFYVIEYWDKFQRPTWWAMLGPMINITQGGLVVYGSLLAGGAALVVFVYKNRLPGLAFTDLIAPGVVIGVALGRIGCFLNGCCYGGITDLPWAVTFPPGSPAYLDQVQHGELFLQGMIFAGSGPDPAIVGEVEPNSAAARQGLKPGDQVTEINGRTVRSVDAAQVELLRIFGAGAPVSVKVAGAEQAKNWTVTAKPPRSRPVHPAQLYSLFDALLLCVFLLLYEPYKRRDGELTALVLTIHPISRFLLEIIRVDESPVFNTGMSISQNISLLIFAGGIGLWLYLWSRPRGCTWPGLAVAAPRQNLPEIAARHGARPI